MDNETARPTRRLFRELLMNGLRNDVGSVPISGQFWQVGQIVMAPTREAKDHLLEAVYRALNGESEAATDSLVHYATAVADYFADECMAIIEGKCSSLCHPEEPCSITEDGKCDVERTKGTP